MLSTFPKTNFDFRAANALNLDKTKILLFGPS